MFGFSLCKSHNDLVHPDLCGADDLQWWTRSAPASLPEEAAPSVDNTLPATTQRDVFC